MARRHRLDKLALARHLVTAKRRLPSKRRSRLQVELDRLVAKLAACVFERRRGRDDRRGLVVVVDDFRHAFFFHIWRPKIGEQYARFALEDDLRANCCARGANA